MQVACAGDGRKPLGLREWNGWSLPSRRTGFVEKNGKKCKTSEQRAHRPPTCLPACLRACRALQTFIHTYIHTYKQTRTTKAPTIHLSIYPSIHLPLSPFPATRQPLFLPHVCFFRRKEEQKKRKKKKKNRREKKRGKKKVEE